MSYQVIKASKVVSVRFPTPLTLLIPIHSLGLLLALTLMQHSINFTQQSTAITKIPSLGIFIDLKGAFDNVTFDSIIAALYQLKVPHHIIHRITNYIFCTSKPNKTFRHIFRFSYLQIFLQFR